jgi:hypothetical protein
MRRDAGLGSEGALPHSASGDPCANQRLGFPSFASFSSTSSASSTSRASNFYPSLEPTPFGGVVAARWPLETVSRTASRRGRIPLSNRTPAKEPSQ